MKQNTFTFIKALLFPVLIVSVPLIGLCAAMILTPLFVGFMNKVFFVFQDSMAGSIMGRLAIAAMFAIYFGFMTYLFHTAFRLIHFLRDKMG